MISVHDIDRLDAFCRRNGIHDHAQKRFRIACFKKGQPLEACLLTIPEAARAKFAESIRFQSLELSARQDSNLDGASKLVFRTEDGKNIEAVILRIESGRTSLCISSQIGCAADCAFCATGRMGLTRNLTTHEILDQVILANRVLRDEGRVVRNVVFMGMGEPLHNEQHVHAALAFLRDPRGCYLADRHLLVSTVGVHQAMRRFAEKFPDMRLALSLHGARQEVREKIMPTARYHSLERLRDVLPDLAARGNLMIEYVLLQDVNDGPGDLAALIEYLRGLPVHINLIQFNPFAGAGFTPVTRAAREAFGEALRAAGFKVTLRYSLGDDIAAACGQLAESLEKGRGASV